MKQPPQCPYCPEHPFVWKDMSRATVHDPSNWRWHCTGCNGEWTPNIQQKMEYA